MNRIHDNVGDMFMSVLCGLVLLGAARLCYGVALGHLPDDLLLSGVDPMTRLALMRLFVFAVIVAVLALPLSWLLSRAATAGELASVFPGATCTAVLFVLQEELQPFHPFPAWLAMACAGVLFVALPLGVSAWWRRRA